MIVWLLVAAAAALLLYPSQQPVPLPFGVTQADKSTPDYMAAVRSMQVVRRRLVATKMLAEAEAKALDVLTLALGAGSDQ